MSASETSARATGYLGVDLGGTRMRLALFDETGRIEQKNVSQTDPEHPECLVEAMRSLLRETPLRIERAVVGVPGPISYRDGVPLKLPNLPKWEGRLSAPQLEEDLDVPVKLANDADLAALGEHRFGAGRGVSDMLYVTSSTGVGAGVIVDGRLLRGRWSMAEAGHMVIDWKTGETVEWLGSGSTLARLSGLDGPALDKLILAGDARAAAIFASVAEAFAVGVHNLVHCFMPERVVIGGGVSRSGELLLGPLRARLESCTDGCSVGGRDVFIAAAGDDVGLLGAFAYARELAGQSEAAG